MHVFTEILFYNDVINRFFICIIVSDCFVVSCSMLLVLEVFAFCGSNMLELMEVKFVMELFTVD